ncbi:hypothetical protein EVA_15146 [gut metagenome]|uniref:Uncharacterized protein n=1 Tax=gut metagenome TaxID=749906 RepID=J9G4K6_9ZZZZ
MEKFQESLRHFSQALQQGLMVSVHRTERLHREVFLSCKYLIHLPMSVARNTIYQKYRNLWKRFPGCSLR